jgi:ectoine hydroxylase-related dioxygenase (phytanoyl-CoA dioxygenase family)
MSFDGKALAAQLKEKGYLALEGFFDKEIVNSLYEASLTRLSRQSYNGTVGYMQTPLQRFCQYPFTLHRGVFDILLDERMVSIAENFAGGPVFIQDQRLYQTFPGYQMPWHVDNKESQLDGSEKVMDIKGIIFLVYLHDVKPGGGGFQIVKGSHKWASKENREMWDDEIHKYEDDIITFDNKPAGTLVMFDYRNIHRAEPFYEGKERTAIFGSYVHEGQSAGEPIVLDTRFLKDLTEKQMRLLKFGIDPTAKNWPIPDDLPQDVPGIAKQGMIGKIISKFA